MNISTPGEAEPIFSIIIPLEFHRGQWEACWTAWQKQTVDVAEYEIILAVPRDFPHLDEMLRDARSGHRIVYSDQLHDMSLCAQGARVARGKYLFFTESHCWPETDVLALCKTAFTEHPEWAALSCQSIPIVHNRLSRAEAEMYRADIEFGMKQHEWRKVLDQCFVTTREAYFSCGGLDADLGHFAEWVLAAEYFAQGYKIGYLPEAKFHHYYVGSLAELDIFTLDFVEGEIRYFARRDAPRHNLIEPPGEWTCRANHDRRQARRILSLLARRIFGDPRIWKAHLSQLTEWAGRAVAGNGASRWSAAVRIAVARTRLLIARSFATDELLVVRFRNYIAALICYQRLACIDRVNRLGPTAFALGDAVPATSAVPSGTGFHGIERWNAEVFRWSEMAAITEVVLPPGRHAIVIECLPVRDLQRAGLRFYLNERRIPRSDIAIESNRITIRIDHAALDPTRLDAVRLGWTCRSLPAKNDSRCLGLPIRALRLDAGAAKTA